ncbi:MAG: hypothetical protein QG574_4801 [Cyanobacteriota bacterium erpe_2018_sw_21hr_WHONDRS-SW48-000092_B_bin.40]|nr:hypothetical protein [Cyanobacteriota bacterium erpe_2018_sw_21hr_WHONDRS-SW48-000092_B_bin.40]
MPASGPDTRVGQRDRPPVITAPIKPEKRPISAGTPAAMATPMFSGRATSSSKTAAESSFESFGCEGVAGFDGMQSLSPMAAAVLLRRGR